MVYNDFKLYNRVTEIRFKQNLKILMDCFLELLWMAVCCFIQSATSSPRALFENCPVGLYGKVCNLSCNPHCATGCHMITGICNGPCYPGWMGPHCDQRCPDYQYGVNCQLTCGHCENDATCDPVNGTCPGGCVPGFTGVGCNQACEPYTFGKDCLEQCYNCRHSKPCNVVTGACINDCDPGWVGEKCDQVCANGSFGIDCTGICGHCAGNQTCDHLIGLCQNGCKDGWIEEKCDLPCPVGHYGPACIRVCGHCKAGACDHETGRCLEGCNKGWKGPACHIACDAGEFGEDCREKCGHCFDNACDRATGICVQGCESGWQEMQCKTPCSPGKFGPGCTMFCGHCRTSSGCNSSTGVCQDGCLEGWEGTSCQFSVREANSKSPTDLENVPDKKPQLVSFLTAAVVLLVLALSSTVVYFVCIRPRKTAIASRLDRLASQRDDHYTEAHIYEQVQAGPWEITKSNLIITPEKLGHGQFGQVRKGYIKNIRSHNVPVALKTLKVSASEKDKNDFMNELQILKKVGHHLNVVCLVGSCHITGVLYVAMEFCTRGDLRTYLRRSRKKNQKVYTNVQSFAPMPKAVQLKFALDVASGMAHLAERQIIHRDLAARNVLLDDNMVAKVADFGLSKNDETYVKTSHTRVPVRWLALESLFNNQYSTQSDVWSFGILLWEICTFGGTPYHGMDTQQFCNLLKQGYRLRRPRHCEALLYAMMLQCWLESPEARPDFYDLQSRLQKMLDDTQIYINIDEEMQYSTIDSER